MAKQVTSGGTATRVAVKVRSRAPTAILFGAVDQVRAVVGRNAAVGGYRSFSHLLYVL